VEFLTRLPVAGFPGAVGLSAGSLTSSHPKAAALAVFDQAYDGSGLIVMPLGRGHRELLSAVSSVTFINEYRT
jgi:hypothetical protein